MRFHDKEYYQTSLERLSQARRLASKAGNYALAMYCGGLAVECLLRAFRWRHDKSFEGRHDLYDLLKASGILRVDEEYMRLRGKDEDLIHKSSREFRAAINSIAILWHNNLRFASEAKLKVYLTQINRVQGIKGDPLKKNATDLIEAASLVISRGMVLWDSRKT